MKDRTEALLWAIALLLFVMVVRGFFGPPMTGGT